MRHFYLLLLLFLVSLPISLSGCGNDSSVSQTESNFAASETCITCHETSRITSSVTLASITDEWSASKHSTMKGASCIDCHGSGNGHPSSCGGCHGGSTTVGLEFHNPVAAGRCYACHATTSLGYPHFANYTTSLAAQYISQTDAAGVQCRQCHNPHDTTSLMQYNRDWAESGHGDVHFVSGNASASSVNSHYPWTTANRDACAKCHTTSGYKKFVSGGFTQLGDVVTPAPALSNNKKNEAIMCSACHQDYSWKRRTIGAQTLQYTYNGVAVVLPNVGDSNLCVVCHGGRGNFQSARSTRFQGHHLPIGADLFAEFSHVGFEFTGRSYTKPTYFKHDIIGLAGGSGPCVSCHMKSTKSHTYGVVTKDANGVITAINTQAVCNTCHTVGTKYEMTAAKLEEESEGYKQAGVLLKAYLNNTIANYHTKPIISSTGAPIDLNGYKYVQDPKSTSTDVDIDTMPEIDYGAFQNQLYPTEDPGAFAHNRIYVKRLLFDSIDGLDNGVFNGTITINATTYPAAASWFGADATTGIASRP